MTGATGTTGGTGSTARPWEESITFWEGFRIRWAGLMDRARARKVPDDQLTHYLHELQERAQGYQIKVLEWASAEDARLEVSLATQGAVAAQSIDAATANHDVVPENGSKKDRAAWATAQRGAKQAAAAREHQQRRRDDARSAVLSLNQQRASLAEQRDIQFALCQQWFDRRAAKYNRARTGWFGLPKTSEHKIPEFEPVEFIESKPLDIAQIGDPPEGEAVGAGFNSRSTHDAGETGTSNSGGAA